MQAVASSPMLGNASRNLTLSDLALESAIEIEKCQATGKASFVALKQLGQALDASATRDLTLFPVYDRALASSRGNVRPTSKSDLYGRLREITERMNSITSESADLALLRDFCLALHDALLNYRIEHIHRPMTGPTTPKS
jgi:hypothetical protein